MRGAVLTLYALLLLPVPALALAQGQAIATVKSDAPIYVRAEVMQTPLRVAAVGTRLRVLEDDGEWLQVQFNDPTLGLRVGWVQRKFVDIATNLAPMDLSVGTKESQPPANAAVAQTSMRNVTFPAYETSIGWSFLHISDPVLSVNSTLGWNISVAGNLAPWLGLVGDFTGNYKTKLLGFDNVDAMQHGFLGGPRFAFRQSLAVPYGQFAVGLVRTDISVPGVHVGSNDFAIQPGGGIDIGGPNVAARFEVALRRVFYEGGAGNQFRMVIGVVVRSGAKR